MNSASLTTLEPVEAWLGYLDAWFSDAPEKDADAEFEGQQASEQEAANQERALEKVERGGVW